MEQHIGLGWCLTSYKHVIQTRNSEPGMLHLFAPKSDAAGVWISGSKTMALMDSSPWTWQKIATHPWAKNLQWLLSDWFLKHGMGNWAIACYQSEQLLVKRVFQAVIVLLSQIDTIISHLPHIRARQLFFPDKFHIIHLFFVQPQGLCQGAKSIGLVCQEQMIAFGSNKIQRLILMTT